MADVKTVRACGAGLLSGLSLEVLLHGLPSASRPGVRWFEEEEPWDYALCAKRSTVLTHRPSGKQMSTPEHLSAAALGWPTKATQLHAPLGDIPILDGSALPWRMLFEELHGKPTGELAWYEAPVSANREWEGGYWEISPSEGDALEIEYALDRFAYKKCLRRVIRCYTDLDDMLKARTFIFEPEFEMAQKQGLLPGAAEGCGLLLRGNHTDAPEVLYGGPLRHRDEPVLHKMLDLLGDLALFGPFLPKLRVRIHNGGHVAHQQILERLIPYVFH